MRARISPAGGRALPSEAVCQVDQARLEKATPAEVWLRGAGQLAALLDSARLNGSLRYGQIGAVSSARISDTGRPHIWVRPPVLPFSNSSSLRQPATASTRCCATLAPSQLQTP